MVNSQFEVVTFPVFQAASQSLTMQGPDEDDCMVIDSTS